MSDVRFQDKYRRYIRDPRCAANAPGVGTNALKASANVRGSGGRSGNNSRPLTEMAEGRAVTAFFARVLGTAFAPPTMHLTREDGPMVKSTASGSKTVPGAARVFRLEGGRVKRDLSPAAMTGEGSALIQPGPRGAPNAEQIRVRAYEKWCRAGRPTDDGVHFWLEAERELRAET